MIIGVPKEIKNHEGRVGLVPSGAAELVGVGHTVVVEVAAGVGAGFSDQDYSQAGASLRPSAESVYAEADLIIKVKEPLPPEYPLLRAGQVLFTFLHLAPALELTKALLERQVVGIAYETVQLDDGSLPLLTPMSEVAGKMSVQLGAHWLEGHNGGSGVLLGGVPGTPPAEVAVVGGGTVGMNAAMVALGMGANVTVLDIDLQRLRYLESTLGGRLKGVASDARSVEAAMARADLVIGAVLSPGAKAKRVITRAMMGGRRKGSVVVDVAIDQGGCVEGSVPTTFDDPVLRVDGVNLCCVANLPAAVSRTATQALTNVTFPYVRRLADTGYDAALAADPALRRGLNVYKGRLLNQAVAEGCGLQCSADGP